MLRARSIDEQKRVTPHPILYTIVPFKQPAEVLIIHQQKNGDCSIAVLCAAFNVMGSTEIDAIFRQGQVGMSREFISTESTLLTKGKIIGKRGI